MVVLARKLEPLEVRVEVGLGVKGGAVDPGQHLAVLVAAPVGARDRVQLEGLDPPGGGRVRPAAEVGERAVAIQRHRLDPLVADQVLDQLDLVGLVLGRKRSIASAAETLGAFERLVGADVLAHRRLDPLQVVLARALAVRELEVVVEAAIDRWTDRDLGPGPELGDRRRHHVSGVVAHEPERRLRVLALAAGGDDPDLGTVMKRGTQVAQLTVDLDPKRILRQPGADRRRGVGAARARLELERRAVGKRHGEGRHGGHATANVSMGPQTHGPKPVSRPRSDRRGRRPGSAGTGRAPRPPRSAQARRAPPRRRPGRP